MPVVNSRNLSSLSHILGKDRCKVTRRRINRNVDQSMSTRRKSAASMFPPDHDRLSQLAEKFSIDVLQNHMLQRAASRHGLTKSIYYYNNTFTTLSLLAGEAVRRRTAASWGRQEDQPRRESQGQILSSETEESEAHLVVIKNRDDTDELTIKILLFQLPWPRSTTSRTTRMRSEVAAVASLEEASWRWTWRTRSFRAGGPRTWRTRLRRRGWWCRTWWCTAARTSTRTSTWFLRQSLPAHVSSRYTDMVISIVKYIIHSEHPHIGRCDDALPQLQPESKQALRVLRLRPQRRRGRRRKRRRRRIILGSKESSSEESQRNRSWIQRNGQNHQGNNNKPLIWDLKCTDFLLFPQMMGEKQKEDEQINEILKDWKMLAQKADYVLFWIFFIITTFTR